MTEHERAVRELLRSSEEAKHILKAVVVPLEHSTSNIDADERPAGGSQNRITLALVTHKDAKSGREEGCIFVFKPMAQVNVLEIQSLFPVTTNFSISLSIAQNPPGAPPSSLISQPKTGLQLTISSGTEDGPEQLTALTYDVLCLRSILGECHRLKELYGIASHSITNKTHVWILPYLSEFQTFSKLSSIPLDLRIPHRPLHSRLSPSSAGFPVDEAGNIRVVRDDWVRNSVWNTGMDGSALCKRNIRIHIGTFNVNGKSPSQDLSPWVASHPESQLSKETPVDPDNSKIKSPLHPRSPLRELLYLVIPKSGAKSTSADPNAECKGENYCRDPDILVFAFQEVDLSAETLLYSTSTAKEDAWCLALFAALGEKAVLYEKLASKQMVGVLLVVIVKKSLKACFHDIRAASAGVGILGKMGNKGGVALRMQFSPLPSPEIPYPSSTIFTFVNSHLAAFDEMIDKRNADFHELTTRLAFESEDDPDDPPFSVYETDTLFWMVNLNYRIDLPDADVRQILSSEWQGKLEILLKYDQLKGVISTKKAFGVFSELPITHLPTYRFSTGVLTDDMGYDMKRKPAWTDRILHAGGPSAKVKQLSYAGHPEITFSDHRPVSANFDVTITTFDQQERDSAIPKFCQLVSDVAHSTEHPDILVEPKTVEFGKVSYKRPVSRKVVLRNNGKVPCVYYFVPIELGRPIHPPWMHIEPMAGLLLPDETVSITLSACIDNDTASELHSRLARVLDAPLILHTARGQDYFILVTGEYDLTCFANTLSTLTRLPGPIRTVQSIEDLLPEDRAINAPREIMRLVHWLMSNTVEVVGLFTTPAEEELVNTIRECLDTGDEFPFTPPHDRRISLAFGDALLQLFDSLSEPLVPPSVHARCVEVTSRDEAFEVLDALPSVSVNVWISLTAFLHFISLQAQTHSGVTESLAIVFSPILLRDDPSQQYNPVSPLGKHKFLLHFIT